MMFSTNYIDPNGEILTKITYRNDLHKFRKQYDHLYENIVPLGNNKVSLYGPDDKSLYPSDFVPRVKENFTEYCFCELRQMKRIQITPHPEYNTPFGTLDLNRNSWYEIAFSYGPLHGKRRVEEPELLYIGENSGGQNSTHNRIMMGFRALAGQLYENETHGLTKHREFMKETWGIDVWDKDLCFFIRVSYMPSDEMMKPFDAEMIEGALIEDAVQQKVHGKNHFLVNRRF